MYIRKTRERLLASTIIGGAILAAVSATPAMAQDEPTEVDEIVVTGSRIIRSDLTSASPITITSGEDLRESGVINLGEALRRDPAVSAGGFNQSSILSGGGASTIDLRNLGSNRSLILINGRRFSLFTDSLQNEGNDVSFLPAGMLERVEILRDGAGPTYGADAVAGVVNFIMREGFDGVEVGAFYGMSEEGDAAQYRVNGVVGISSDRGDITFGLEYAHRDELPQASRPWALNPIGNITATGVTTGSGFAPGAQLRRTSNNSLVRCYNNDGGVVPVGSACPRYDYGLVQSFIGSSTLLNVAANATYEITPGIEAFASMIYGNRESASDLAANPMGANQPTGPFLNGIVISATSTSNPFGEAVSLQWRPQAYGGREGFQDASQLWTTVGLRGEIFDNYNWDASTTYSRTSSMTGTRNLPWATRLQRILNNDCQTDPVCRAAGQVTNIDNLFSGATPFTQAQRDYVFYTGATASLFESRQTQLNLTGPLFDLPAGTVGFAVGIENRSENGEATPDPVAASGEALANATNPTSGSFSSTEVYGEIEIPLLADIPLIDRLTINLQGRYSDFSNFGGADTYKVGVDWAVTDWFRLRGTYGTSYRAPNILDLYNGGVESFSFITDPCNTGSTNATVNANCNALGRPVGYTQAAPQIRVNAGGNPNLTPEEGTSTTVGFVVSPHFIPGFALTADWYQIELDNAIVGGPLANNLATCYADPNFLVLRADPTSNCFRLDSRTTSFNLATLDNRLTNADGTTTVEGVDWVLRYGYDGILGGGINVFWTNSHLLSYDDDGFDLAGLIQADASASYPEWRSVFELEYYANNWSASWIVNYQSAVEDIRTNLGILPTPNFLNYDGVDSYATHDVRFRYNWENTGFVFGINNVMGEDAPYAFNSGNNTIPSAYDIIGRYFFVSLTQNF